MDSEKFFVMLFFAVFGGAALFFYIRMYVRKYKALYAEGKELYQQKQARLEGKDLSRQARPSPSPHDS